MNEVFGWVYAILVFSGSYYLLSKFIDWIVYLAWIKPRLKKEEQKQKDLDKVMKRFVLNHQICAHIMYDPEFHSHMENLEKELNINGIITEK